MATRLATPRFEARAPARPRGGRLFGLLALAAIAASLAAGAWGLSTRLLGTPEAPAAGVAAADAPAAAAASSGGAPGTPLASDPQAVMLARSDGDVLFGLAVRPGGPVDLVLLSGHAGPVAADDVRVTVDTGEVVPSSCGTGCFRIEHAALAGKPTALSVEVVQHGAPAATAAFSLPAEPPPPGDELLAAVEETMGSLRSLQIEQSLSAHTGTFRTSFVFQAPDRARFEASDGSASVLIGKRRWDLRDGGWLPAEFPGVQVPTYFWGGATHPRVLGETTVAGEPGQILSLFSAAGGPWWFRLVVAEDGRVLEAEMLGPDHVMLERYAGLNEPVTIEPPS